MQVYAINFHGEHTRDGYWTAGVFSDKAKADRVCAWLNEIMKLNHQLWMQDGDLPKSIEQMKEIVGQEGYYEVVTEDVFDTAADWMAAHSIKNHQGISDWPQVDDIEVALKANDPNHDLTKEAEQLRLF